MAWDFCAEPDCQPTLGWIEKLVAEQLHLVKASLACLGHEDPQRALAPLKQQMRGQGSWRTIRQRDWAAEDLRCGD
jgi:hypothetical protein